MKATQIMFYYIQHTKKSAVACAVRYKQFLSRYIHVVYFLPDSFTKDADIKRT